MARGRGHGHGCGCGRGRGRGCIPIHAAFNYKEEVPPMEEHHGEEPLAEELGAA